MTTEEIKKYAWAYATKDDDSVNLLEKNAFIAGANFVSGIVIKPTTLYAFLYNPMIHESSSQTVSIHRTREGAEKALEWHRKGIVNLGNEKEWRIEEITVKD
jgi:hypothetical protein